MPKFLKTAFGSYLELFAKAPIYILTFLLPIFFLPWTADVLDFNKQALLIFCVLISLLFWLFNSLANNKFQIVISGLYIPVAVFFIVFALSTLFSLWRYGSFWGVLSISEGFVSILSLILLYLLVSNLFSRKETIVLLLIFILSGILASIFGVFQFLGKFILHFDFAQMASFNTIGSAGGMGIFAAALFPLIFFGLIVSKRVLRAIFWVALVVCAALLFLANSFSAWLLTLIGACLIIVIGMQKKNLIKSSWMILPMFFLALSLFFGFLNIRVWQVPGASNRPTEVLLDHNASMDIALKTVRDKLLLGSGPGTFAFDFSKYKDVAFNKNNLWNIRFQSGYSEAVNLFAVTGLLGIVSYLFFAVFAILYGLSVLLRNRKTGGSISPEDDKEDLSDIVLWAISCGIFISFVLLIVGSFVYYSNLSLQFTLFLLLGCFLSLNYSQKKEFILKPSSLTALVYTFFATMIFLFGLGIMIVEAQRYAAEIYYFNAIKQWQKGDLQSAQNSLEKAASTNYKIDAYWRDLSQLYLQRMDETVAKNDVPKEKLAQNIQGFINNSINSAKMATDVNLNNVANWSVRGFVYQNLQGIIGGVEDWAIKTYDEAIRLEPANPYFFNQQGIVYLRQSLALSDKDKAAEKENMLTDARARFDRAIELKSDYAPARFQIAQIYQAQGKTDEAISELEETKNYAPFDTGLAFQLGLVYYQKEDYGKAKAEFERAIGLDNTYSNALYFLGLIADKENNRDKAREYFNQIANLNPDNEEIRRIIDNLDNGRPVLDGIAQQSPSDTPISEAPSEINSTNAAESASGIEAVPASGKNSETKLKAATSD